MTAGNNGDGENGAGKKKLQVVAMDYARRRKQQMRPTTNRNSDNGLADPYNQLYKLTETVQVVDERIVQMERMLRKLLRLLRNSRAEGKEAPHA